MWLTFVVKDYSVFWGVVFVCFFQGCGFRLSTTLSGQDENNGHQGY